VRNSSAFSIFKLANPDNFEHLQFSGKAGNVVWAAGYNAFGKASITTPAATTDKPTITVNLRLPGQYLDEETGRHYNWHRYYDGEIGRYLTEDPIGLSGGINRYGYVGGNPVNRVDFLGLWGSKAHEHLIDQTFPGLDPTLLQKIKDGSANVDRIANQFGDSAEHAMRNSEGDSAAQARGRACKFIKSKVDTYNALKNSPVAKLRNSAYYTLGEALHPVMNSTSPEHRGWQVWDPYSSQGMRHGNAHGSHEGLDSLNNELLNETKQLMNKTKNGDSCECVL
jgi:RHS repeat-associated protein